MRRPVDGFVQIVLNLVDPVHDGRHVRVVGGVVPVGDAVLDGVNGAADVHVVGGQRRVDVMPQRQVDRHRGAHRGIRGPVRVEPVERRVDLVVDERAAVEDRRRRTGGLGVVRRVQAVLPLQERIAVKQRQVAQIVGIEALEIIVAHADEQGRPSEVGHVGSRSELEIGDEGAFVPRRRERRRRSGLRADGAQRRRRHHLVAASREGRRDRERVGSFDIQPEGSQAGSDEAQTKTHAAPHADRASTLPCIATSSRAPRLDRT